MSDFLTQREVNCFALYLSRNSWSISEIARLLDISESAAISKIYNAMELEGKIAIERIIHCTLRNGKSLNYELDAEFYLGDAYHALYYMNHTNIEEVANYIQSEGDDDIPPEIVLSYEEKQTVEGKKRKQLVKVTRTYPFEEIKQTVEYLDFK